MTSTCLANLVWPSIYVVHYLFASGAIVLGFVVEWLAFRAWVGFSWKKAFLAALVVNALSAALGCILIPLSGLAWEFTGFQLLQSMGAKGTFNPYSWAASWLLAVVINCLVEYWPLIWPFRAKRSWRLWGIVLLANLISVGFAFIASLIMERPTM